jgi:ribosome-associated protein
MRVIVRKKGENQDTPLVITTEYIKLESALKLANAVPTGGQAKMLIQEGEAKVNGEVCTMRGKKLYPGDRFEFMGQKYLITAHAPL